MDSDFLSSTMARGSDSLKSELKSVLCDPDVLETLSTAVAAHVSDALREEVSSLRTRLEEQDREITFLHDKVDALEQYDRRNSIRVIGIPEAEGEVTDNIVKKIGEELSVAVTDDMIERSHRVGRKPGVGESSRARAILVQFSSYRYKQRVMANMKKQLFRADASLLFPDVNWPALSSSRSSASGSSSSSSALRVFINDDLTKTRAELATMARDRMRRNLLEDTWTLDGVIFVKRGGSVYRVTTKQELEVIAA